MAAPTKTTSPIKALTRQLLDMDDTMAKILLKHFEVLAEKMLEDMTTAAGEYLHSLHTRREEDSEDEAKAVVKKFPSALSHLNEKGRLPIQTAVFYSKSVPFLPLLVEEGIKLNVGGEGMRGGLLVDDPVGEDNFNFNVLQLLVLMKMGNDTVFDSRYLGVLIKLRESNLLRKEDIRQNDLSYLSCFPLNQARFEYLVDWDPQGLKGDVGHASLIWGVLDEESNKKIDRFAMALKAGMKHFPDDLGFLFEKGNDGKTICQLAFENLDKDGALRVIQECIPVSANYPFLHHVIMNAPEYMKDFARMYPSATFLRDENGRSFHHVALSSGRNLKNDPMIILQLTDDKVEEKDPVTDLHPFMNAASAEVPDVETIYYLLRRNPSVVDRSRRIVKCKLAKKKAGEKRKRA